MKGLVHLIVDFNPSSHKILFRVKDTGLGVKDGDLEKLFTLFGKLDASQKTNTYGKGLGLNICKKMVNAMGGEINLDINYNDGACFCFDFQCQITEIEESEPPSPELRLFQS